MKKTVPYITGDGVGVEITPAMQAIVNAAVKKAYGNEHEIEWMEVWQESVLLMKQAPGYRMRQ